MSLAIVLVLTSRALAKLEQFGYSPRLSSWWMRSMRSIAGRLSECILGSSSILELSIDGFAIVY